MFWEDKKEPGQDVKKYHTQKEKKRGTALKKIEERSQTGGKRNSANLHTEKKTLW